MRYHNITKDDMVNGDGLRVVLWVAGCSHNCPGCHNPFTHDPNGGLPFDDAAEKEINEQLEKDYIDGITFSGGDPMHEANIKDVLTLAQKIRKQYPDKTIWVYTGYTLEQLRKDDSEIGQLRNELIKTIDVLCDGPFIESLKSPDKEWVGSSNQNVIRL